MKQAKLHLENRLKKCTSYGLSVNDKDILSRFGLQEFIFRKVTSNKFRKWSIDTETKQAIRKALSINLSLNKPIQFTFPWGGYKLWCLPSAPMIDWAEFFAISFYCKFVAPILQVYKPGVEFHFVSDDVVMELMDNIPKNETEIYLKSFDNLLDHFRKYFPNNMKMDIIRVAGFYTKEEFGKEFNKNIKIIQKEQESLSEDCKLRIYKTANLNIKWDGVQPWHLLSEPEKNNKIKMSPIYLDAYCALSKRKAFVRGEDKIVITVECLPETIPLGTTSSSAVKFWTGIGVLEAKNDSKITDRILSPKQWIKVKNQDHKNYKIDLIPLKNLGKIMIFDRAFDFAKK